MGDFFEQEDVSLDPSGVREVIDQGRGEATEFEPSIPKKGKKLAVTACALANNGGGQILLGVQKDGSISGIEGLENVESDAEEILDQNIEQRSDFAYSTYSCSMKEGSIVGIHIKEYDELPLAADGRFYKRRQREDDRLAPHEVQRLMPE